MCMDACLHVCMCTSSCLVPMGAEEGMRSLGTRVTGNKPPCGFWDLNPGTPEELLTFELFSQAFWIAAFLKKQHPGTLLEWAAVKKPGPSVNMTASKSLYTWLPRTAVCQVEVVMTFLCSPCWDVVLTAKMALGKCVHTIGFSSLSLNSVSGHKKCCLIRSRWVWINQELWCRKNISSFENLMSRNHREASSNVKEGLKLARY